MREEVKWFVSGCKREWGATSPAVSHSERRSWPTRRVGKRVFSRRDAGTFVWWPLPRGHLSAEALSVGSSDLSDLVSAGFGSDGTRLHLE